ncbi:MAG: hypothetical protein KDA65_01500 [Planctomycetaceae bacterium]|nr:hypothetical protein [Planctomycetaceae bacterium]
MKTNFGKILVVITFIASVIFLMAAVDLYYGGFNWQEAADEVENYSILPVQGEESHRYQATNMVTNESVGSVSTLPRVLVASLNDEKGKLQSENTELGKEIEAVQKKTNEYKQLIETDIAGLDQKAELLRAELKTTLQEIETLSQEVIGLTTEANKKLEDAEKRREEIARHNSELDEIKTEEYRLQKQKEKLEDLLTRYKEIARALKRRQEQLMQQVDTVAEANP